MLDNHCLENRLYELWNTQIDKISLKSNLSQLTVSYDKNLPTDGFIVESRANTLYLKAYNILAAYHAIHQILQGLESNTLSSILNTVQQPNFAIRAIWLNASTPLAFFNNEILHIPGFLFDATSIHRLCEKIACWGYNTLIINCDIESIVEAQGSLSSKLLASILLKWGIKLFLKVDVSNSSFILDNEFCDKMQSLMQNLSSNVSFIFQGNLSAKAQKQTKREFVLAQIISLAPCFRENQEWMYLLPKELSGEDIYFLHARSPQNILFCFHDTYPQNLSKDSIFCSLKPSESRFNAIFSLNSKADMEQQVCFLPINAWSENFSNYDKRKFSGVIIMMYVVNYQLDPVSDLLAEGAFSLIGRSLWKESNIFFSFRQWLVREIDSVFFHEMKNFVLQIEKIVLDSKMLQEMEVCSSRESSKVILDEFIEKIKKYTQTTERIAYKMATKNPVFWEEWEKKIDSQIKESLRIFCQKNMVSQPSLPIKPFNRKG